MSYLPETSNLPTSFAVDFHATRKKTLGLSHSPSVPLSGLLSGRKRAALLYPSQELRARETVSKL
jgi:hypothetical protein